MFQFIKSTFLSTASRMSRPEWTWDRRFDAEVNVQMGTWLMATDGYGHWVCR